MNIIIPFKNHTPHPLPPTIIYIEKNFESLAKSNQKIEKFFENLCNCLIYKEFMISKKF